MGLQINKPYDRNYFRIKDKHMAATLSHWIINHSLKLRIYSPNWVPLAQMRW